MARYLKPEQTKKVYLYGPKGLCDWFERLTSVYGTWMNKIDIEVIEITKRQQIGAGILDSCETSHTENSICFRFTDKDQRIFFYSGDTDYDEDLLSCMKDADIAVLECSNLSESKIDGHLTPELAARLAHKAAVKHLVLTHMYPEVADSDVRFHISRHFKGTMTIARDGLIIEI
jgi:ribonuclease BN (tRNA processing enzyme)